jgi:hypothetical protein
VLNVWNVLLAAVCDNPPMGIDIDAYFPGGRRLEAHFAVIRAEVAAYLNAHRVPCLHEYSPDIRIDLGTGRRCFGGLWAHPRRVLAFPGRQDKRRASRAVPQRISEPVRAARGRHDRQRHRVLAGPGGRGGAT